VSLDILFAAESLLPARGGAERFALELLGELARRGHRVRALWLSGGAGSDAAIRELPPGVSGHAVPAPARDGEAYWRSIRARCEALTLAASDAPRADVVLTQLHGAPAALAAGAPHVVLLPSYESLCKLALGVGAVVGADGVVPTCPAPHDCAVCPAASVLPEPERAALRAQRAAQDRALAQAAALIACSRAVAAAAKAWSGRDAVVAPWVAAAPVAAGADDGHVLLAAASWMPHKGAALVEPIVRALPDREVAVTAGGIDPAAARRLRDLGARLLDGRIDAALEGAQVCVLPSQWPEPFCRIAFEAQSCGVPVVAPRTGGLPEHVPSRSLVDPAAGPADYVAVVHALADPALWREASAAGRRMAHAVLATKPLWRAADVVERAAS
jgi:glycosyltransferase involved in cell wall biosynthesis